MMTRINEDNIFAVIIKGSLALLLILTLASLIFFPAKTGFGILVGGIIAIANFFWLRNVLQRILEQLPAKPIHYALLRFIARITVTGVVLYLIMTSGWFSLVGLLVGLSIIVANIIGLSIYCALRTGG